MAEFNGILYRKAGGTTELNRSVGGFCVTESAKLEDRWQDGGTIDLSLIMSDTMTFYDGDYVVVKGRPYEVRETISEYTTIDDTRNKYTLKLHYPDIRFKHAVMYNTVEQYNEGVYSWSRPNNTIVTEGSFETLVETCCYNANEVANERVFKIGTISEDIETDFRVLSFSDNNCWAALKQICEEYGTFYTIRANTDAEPDSLYIVDFGVEVGTFPQTIKIGKNQGISELKLNYSDSDVYTQFIVLGSTENLPSSYAEERLQLDTNIEATPPVYDYSMMVKDDKYTRWGRRRMELIYDDIKPSRTGTITGIPENNIFAFYDTDLSSVITEEPTWNPVGGTVHVVEGPLLGYTFEIVGWHAATQKITIKQIADSNGFKLPNEDSEVFRFTEWTKYNLADIRLPESYVTDAKTRLKTRAITGIEYWSQPRASYTLTVDPFFTRKEETELVCGMLIPIVHPAMDIDKSIRIKRIEYDLLNDKYFDVVSIEVSDIEQDNYMNSLHKDVQRTISTIKTAGYVTPSITKGNNITTIYNSIVSGYGFISYDDFLKWCSENQGIMIQALEGEVGSEELVHIINADLLRVNDAFANRILANEVFIGGVEDATEGLVNNYLLHLTSQVATVACDSGGTVTGALPTSTAIVYHGASADTGWSFSGEFSGCAGSVNSSTGIITITGLTTDDSTVTVSATKTDKPTLQAIFRISKVYAGIDGEDGADSVMYYLTPSVDNVVKSMSGTLTPSSVTCAQYKVVGNALPTAGDKTLKYKRSIDASETAYTVAVEVSTSIYIDFILYDGETQLYKTRVPVLIDSSEWETYLDNAAKGIGYVDYDALVAAAAAGTTLLNGGYIRTSLIEAGTIVANHIAALTITANNIANSTITGGKIASATIEAANIKDSTITGGKIALATITAANIFGGTITATEIADATITGGKIALTTIEAANIANSTITGAKIASGTITAANIFGGTITATEIADATITGGKIANTTITGGKLVNGTITATQIQDSTITGGKIAGSTITAANIYGGTITYAEIADSTITGAKIASGTIEATNIANSTITGGKIANTTITNSNIADTTITGSKLVNGTITATQISDSTITASKIVDATITGGKIASATITNANIYAGTITATEIANSTITGGKIANATITNANIVDATIKAAKIDVADLIAASAFIDNLTVKKLTTDIDDDHTSISVSASASGGKAGLVLSGPSSKGASISYTGSAAVISVYDGTNTLQMAEGSFTAYRSGMIASIGVSSLGAELSVTSSGYSAHLKSTDLYVGGLPSTSQTSGHFWRDSNGIVRCGAQGLNFVIGTGYNENTIYFSTT